MRIHGKRGLMATGAGVAVAAAVLVAAPAAWAADEERLVAPGSVETFSGTGCPPDTTGAWNTRVGVFVYPNPPGTGLAYQPHFQPPNPDGSWQVSLPMPDAPDVTRYLVRVVCWDMTGSGDESTRRTFDIATYMVQLDRPAPPTSAPPTTAEPGTPEPGTPTTTTAGPGPTTSVSTPTTTAPAPAGHGTAPAAQAVSAAPHYTG